MQLIDRYLLKNFLQALAIFFATFCGLFVVIDAFGNLEEFISEGERQGGLLPVLAQYYGVRSLVIFDRTSGVLMLVAVMFTLTSLERHNELTALMAAGISKGRLAKPLIIGAVGVSIFALANREVIIPHFRQQLSRKTEDFRGEKGQPVQAQYDHRTNVYLSGRSAFLSERRIEKPHFRMPADLSQYGMQLVADDAVYHDEKSPTNVAVGGAIPPAGYLLRNVSQPTDLNARTSLTLDGNPVLLVPGDTPWLEKNQAFLVSDIPMEQVAGGGAWRRFSSTPEMVQALRSPSTEFGPDVRVAVHARVVSPLMDITLLFLGLPLVLTRENRNIFVAIGMCLGVVGAFFTVVMLCQWLGNNCIITPAAAAWAPLAVFVPAALILCEPLRE